MSSAFDRNFVAHIRCPFGCLTQRTHAPRHFDSVSRLVYHFEHEHTDRMVTVGIQLNSQGVPVVFHLGPPPSVPAAASTPQGSRGAADSNDDRVIRRLESELQRVQLLIAEEGGSFMEIMDVEPSPIVEVPTSSDDESVESDDSDDSDYEEECTAIVKIEKTNK